MCSTENRSPLDHIVTLNAIIENQRGRGERTYVFFGDAEKCFDKLWPEDSLIELHNLGWSARDIMTIYCMNKKAEVIVRTPAGETGEFAISKIVEQGMIHGPVLCSAETAQVNNGKEIVEYDYGPVKIGIPVFMDDVMGAGSHEHVSRTIRNCREMEIKRKFTYGLKKSKYMTIKTGPEVDKAITDKVEAGTIERTSSYRYLGILVNEEGDLEEHMKEKAQKAKTITK